MICVPVKLITSHTSESTSTTVCEENPTPATVTRCPPDKHRCMRVVNRSIQMRRVDKSHFDRLHWYIKCIRNITSKSTNQWKNGIGHAQVIKCQRCVDLCIAFSKYTIKINTKFHSGQSLRHVQCRFNIKVELVFKYNTTSILYWIQLSHRT